MKEETISITTEFIKLQDLLKFAGLTSTGGEAKLVILSGEVSVNDTLCQERGRKIRPGDLVTFRNYRLQVIYAD